MAFPNALLKTKLSDSSMDTLAPIVAFVFNRPEHTRSMLQSLSENDRADESTLFVYCDGPKSSFDIDAVQLTRDIVRSERWCKRVEVVEQERNKGLAESIIFGVSSLLDKFGRVIVVEDDLILDESFLTFMNRCLSEYENNSKIYQVSGFQFPVEAFRDRDRAFLMPITTSWGWATWRDRWDYFEQNPSASWNSASIEVRKAFNLGGVYDYAGMLDQQLAGTIDSWAIRWYWSVFQRRGLVAYPPVSLVDNIGWDGSGTHGARSMRRKKVEAPSHWPLGELQFPENAISEADWNLVLTSISTSQKQWVRWFKYFASKTGLRKK